MEEVSGSGGGSKPDRSDDDGIWGSESESDDDGIWGSESESDDDGSGGGSKPDGSGAASDGLSGSESGSDDESENLIREDNSEGLMKLLNLPKDGNHCSGIGQKDPHYNRGKLIDAFNTSCHLNKLHCLEALLNCGYDWFGEYVAFGVDRLLVAAIISDSKDAAKLVIKYAKEKNVADKLLCLGPGHAYTPLHVAAFSGSCNVIQLLLDEGADPCKRNAKRKLPCDSAQRGSKAMKLLVDAVLNKVRGGPI